MVSGVELILMVQPILMLELSVDSLDIIHMVTSTVTLALYLRRWILARR